MLHLKICVMAAVVVLPIAPLYCQSDIHAELIFPLVPLLIMPTKGGGSSPDDSRSDKPFANAPK